MKWIVLVAAVLAMSGCAKSSSPAVSTLEAGVLKVCTDAPYEPFEFEQDGEMKGIDVDLSRELGARLDLGVEFVPVVFDEIFAALDRGDCDMAASAVSITEERKSQVEFSTGYFEVSQSLLVRTDDVDRYDSFAALANRKVAVQKGTTGADYLTSKAPDIEAMEYQNTEDAQGALRAGEVDALVQDYPVNQFIARGSADLDVATTFTGMATEEYGFAFAKESTDLRDAVNVELAELRENGKYDSVLARYLGTTD